MAEATQKIGLIAGNGKFPFLVLDAARSQGMQVVVAAIKEEASPEIEQCGAAAVYWLSLGELSRLIDTFKQEGVTRAIMAGQVKHKQIFSSIKPDWKLAKLLLSLTTRNTDSLIGAIGKVLGEEGITLMNSTALLEPMLASEGVLTRRGPTDTEQTNITYGRAVAHHLSRFDIGQTVVKVAKPNQDMRFDVPVVGLKTIATMQQAGATCLALDAGRCLLLDREALLSAANDAGICVVAETPVSHIPHHYVP